VELDRGVLTSWPGDYQNFLRKRDEQLATEAEHNAKFDKKLAQEEAWIRQGIKARRTRNEGRVRALQAMRNERGQRREVQGKAKLNLDSGELSGRLVVEVKNASVGYDGEPVIKDFSTRILRGDRVGIVGPNGVGKTTLLKLLLGELTPGKGKVRLGTKLQVAYFDQQRAILDSDKTVMDNLNYGSEMVTINGKQRHVMGYLQDFLFPPKRVLSPVSSLSGGERNRLLLARLFTQPANLLVLDEPTNDLDVETLELLEELLTDYKGTMLLVSHDRTFLDNVVTSTLVFEGGGRVGEYVGGYSDWLRQRKESLADRVKPLIKEEKKSQDRLVKTPGQGDGAKPRKLSYKEQRELEELPVRIEVLENEQTELHSKTSNAEFYQQDKESIASTLARLEEVEKELEHCFERWEALEEN
jgi:ATP-binding cassette subfamily F protein uup